MPDHGISVLFMASTSFSGQSNILTFQCFLAITIFLCFFFGNFVRVTFYHFIMAGVSSMAPLNVCITCSRNDSFCMFTQTECCLERDEHNQQRDAVK